MSKLIQSGNLYFRVTADKCENFCQNNGVCKKNEEGEPYCVCSGSFTGNKCHVSVCGIQKYAKQILKRGRSIMNNNHNST